MQRLPRFAKCLTVLLGAATVAACGPPPEVSTPTDVRESPSTTGAPAFSDVPATAEVSDEAEHTALTSTIHEVTVYSDRAQVTRQATAQVSTQPTVFAFEHLPGWVDDGSVRVGVSAGRILDVQVQRAFLAQSTDETYKRAEQRHQELTSQLAALDDELQILYAQQAQIESIRAFSMEKVTDDVTNARVGIETYGSVVSFVSDALRDTAEARRKVQRQRELLMPELNASQRALDELDSLMSLEETTVLVTLLSSQATSSDIELNYMMPGATWEPMHELRVSTSNDKTVEVISYAVVTQSSGEDWDNAELFFSTQSALESVRIPELEALTLGETETTSRRLTSRVSSFSRAEQAFAGQNELWNKVHQKSSAASRNFEEVYQSNMELLQTTQSRTVQIFQSLQQRGTTAHFKALAAKSVRGDGHQVRLRIGHSTLSSVQKIVAVPEQSLNAARTLEMTNASAQALLPGRVALYQDGAFLGMTDIDFIADGEDFALFLSVADHLKLSRKLDRKSSSLVRKKHTRMLVSFIVTVENLSDAPTSLTLADRIPVSENKEIKVDKVVIEPAETPDSEGLLRWSLTLGPKEVRTFRIGYQVEYPPTLVLETKRQRDMDPMPSPAQSPMRKSYQIEDQLMDLEENF